MGREVFKASDRCESRANQEFSRDGVVWIDTPGLDEDVRGEDDRLARQGAFELADYLFLVHNIRAGELDRYELDLYRGMMARSWDHKSRMFLVLTKIDQLNQEDGYRVFQRVQAQLPGITVVPVSALRYQRGIYEGKEKFVELSGMSDLLALTEQLKRGLQSSRQQEIAHLRGEVRRQLQQRINRLEANLAQREEQRYERRCRFVSAVDQTLNTVAAYG
ncbi:hypothetical protein J7438_02445 [Thalassotalea sp. G20_0]|uniref:hypothetical protein n=1 Tax=Thalassotalea sp. G20_0 TaxID=2821093 RepID=UPI001AD9BCB4|nr:hypothetical protein [Thalassotalea sp. G20_0]MBO9492952.1 hypothetical protein [Thalassotalea sp. G20_0]